MASYEEIFGLYSDTALRNRVEIAMLSVADQVRSESEATPSHARRLAWARNVFIDPSAWLLPVFRLFLIASKASDASAISSVTPAQIETPILDAVDFLASE